MPSKLLTLAQTEEYIDKENSAGRTAYWEGWTLITWRPNSRGMLRPDGSLYKGRWGTQRRIEPDSLGRYRVYV